VNVKSHILISVGENSPFGVLSMGEYEDTLRDIEKSFGFVPGFMKALPKDSLTKDWPLLKKYQRASQKSHGSTANS
jgi:hypothetical protein